MLKAKIDIYSHFFKVSHIHPSLYFMMKDAFRELTEVKRIKQYGRVRKQMTRIFAARGVGGSEYRFHINYLNRFKELLMYANVSDAELEYTQHDLYEPKDAIKPFSDVTGKPLYDYQEDMKSYILDKGVSKLVTLFTGFGKTKCSLNAGTAINKRTMILVLGRYREKWTQDVKEIYGKDCNVYVVPGLAGLINLIQLAKEGKPIPDVIILTVTVMQIYIREWEAHGGLEIDGMIPPEEIYQTLGIGYRIIDEAHQHYHAVFKIDLYTHCPKCVYLTATLDTHDRFMNFIYLLMWPMSIRTSTPEFDKYDQTFALCFHHSAPDRIRCTSNQGYSHILYEQSIWKHVPSRCQYLDMIGDVVEQHFLPVYKPGRKMLIFCSLVQSCMDVAHYLNHRFKEQGWQISKFTSGDPKAIIDTNDITVSTLGKAGTALDVPGLITCLMTVALSEPKANKQAKGRLRNLTKKPGFEDVIPRFLYFCGMDLDKHRQYHLEKKTLFAPFTTLHQEIQSGYTIGIPMHEYLQFNKPTYWEGWQATDKRNRR